MTNVRLQIATVVLVVALTMRLTAADISGSWKSIVVSEIGKREYLFTFIVESSKLTGTIYRKQVGESKIQNGRIEDDRISFVEFGRFDGQPFKIYYSGTVKSHNEIAFTRTVVGMVGATEQTVATRIK